jgi:hypothetical protein
MEEGHQNSKRLSYRTKFKHEVIWCAEKKGNHKVVMEATFNCDEKHKAVISECEAP